MEVQRSLLQPPVLPAPLLPGSRRSLDRSAARSVSASAPGRLCVGPAQPSVSAVFTVCGDCGGAGVAGGSLFWPLPLRCLPSPCSSPSPSPSLALPLSPSSSSQRRPTPHADAAADALRSATFHHLLQSASSTHISHSTPPIVHWRSARLAPFIAKASPASACPPASPQRYLTSRSRLSRWPPILLMSD